MSLTKNVLRLINWYFYRNSPFCNDIIKYHTLARKNNAFKNAKNIYLSLKLLGQLFQSFLSEIKMHTTHAVLDSQDTQLATVTIVICIPKANPLN